MPLWALSGASQAPPEPSERRKARFIAPAEEGVRVAETPPVERQSGSCGSDPMVCRWGPHSCVGGVCAEPCRLNQHCPQGYYCSLAGNFNGNETVPVCLVYPASGTFALQGGASCSENGDCASNFCEATHRICLDMCTDDGSCASGLACTGAFVELPGGGPVTTVRMCLGGPDPLNSGDLLIDRALEKRVNLFLGPDTVREIDPEATNIIMGACQQHNAAKEGPHLSGCPSHTEEIIGGIFGLYPDVQRPGYADKPEASRLGDLLKTILATKH